MAKNPILPLYYEDRNLISVEELLMMGFRLSDKDMLHAPGIYLWTVLHNHGMHIMYVGYSMRIRSRYKTHETGKIIKKNERHVGSIKFFFLSLPGRSIESILDLEYDWIRSFRPPYNIKDNG